MANSTKLFTLGKDNDELNFLGKPIKLTLGKIYYIMKIIINFKGDFIWVI